MSIPADIFLSLIIGTSAALFLTDQTKRQKDFANAPLVEGRSFVSDELCPQFVQEFSKTPSHVWNSKEASENVSMRTIQMFVENCQKRQQLVDERKIQYAMDESDAMKIPSPGVLHHLSLHSDGDSAGQ